MQELRKVNSNQIFELWKNVSIGLLTLMAVMVGSRILPFYLSPVVGLLGASFLYTLLYNNKLRGGKGCLLVPYALFFCIIIYAFVSILVNVLYIWGLMHIPDEFIFFNDPYIPTLWMNPIGFFTLLVIYLRRRRLRLCIDCQVQNGNHGDRGVYGSIIDVEKKFQLRNLTMLAGVLTVIVWTYYLVEYEQINTNAKDRYIFFWITLIGLGLDLIYFAYRYFNLYLDLQEHDEIITPDELRDMTARTYLRFYVICGNDVFLQRDMVDYTNPVHHGIDTPFNTKRHVNGITTPEVRQIIKDMTGGKEGELKFFFGRKAPNHEKYSLLRYFYFLDGKPEDYPDMKEKGEWMDFNEIKKIYSLNPGALTQTGVNDLTRIATILLTEKKFHEDGSRKVKLKSYQPTFDLYDLRESELDFQDDKWIKVALFNSDSRFYKIRKWFRDLTNCKKLKRKY